MPTLVRGIETIELRSLGFQAAVLFGLILLRPSTATQAQETIDDVARDLRSWRDQIQSLRVVEERDSQAVWVLRQRGQRQTDPAGEGAPRSRDYRGGPVQ